MREIAYIALGSNVGDRHAYLAFARESVAAIPGSRVVAASSIEETAPLGDGPQRAYLNQMIAVETRLTPHALLLELQLIEAAAGRERTRHWAPRTLDLDIVLFGDRRVVEAELNIPHPALPDRDFWQRELTEIRSALRV